MSSSTARRARRMPKKAKARILQELRLLPTVCPACGRIHTGDPGKHPACAGMHPSAAKVRL